MNSSQCLPTDYYVDSSNCFYAQWEGRSRKDFLIPFIKERMIKRILLVVRDVALLGQMSIAVSAVRIDSALVD